MFWTLASFIAVAALALSLGFNLYFALDGVPNTTISAWAKAVLRVSTAVPFGVGAVFAHWADLGIRRPPFGGWIFLALLLLLVALDIALRGQLAQATHPVVWLWVGLASGATLWSMSFQTAL